MNTYEIEGRRYEAKNEYDAVKQAYKMADKIVFDGYAGNHVGRETWYYTAEFRCGHAHVKVQRILQECDTWVTIRATNPLPEEDRIFAAWYYKIYERFCF
jgi:hypothetical protein